MKESNTKEDVAWAVIVMAVALLVLAKMLD